MKPKYSLYGCIWRLEQRLLKLKKRGRIVGFFNYVFGESNQIEKEADEIETAIFYLKQYNVIINKTDNTL